MRVLYDHQKFTTQHYGGVSRYFFELFRNFDREKVTVLRSAVLSQNYHSTSKKPLYLFRKGTIAYWLFERLFRIAKELINRPATLAYLLLNRFDIFHPTDFNPYFMPFLRKPFVVTVHDMTTEKFPEYFPIGNKISVRKKLLIEKATKIIAVSQTTKTDLVTIMNIPPEKISVVYHGNSLKPRNGVDFINTELPRKYLLYVGTRELYKNFKFFVREIASILQSDNDLHVVCIGGGQFTSEECEFFEKDNLRSRYTQLHLSDDELAMCYKNAVAFIFPSLYEGFGMPILESFECSCPAILSNRGSMQEIAGDAALYFDPAKPGELATQVLRLVNEPGLRDNLIAKGHDRSKFFSWQKAAEETYQVYKSALLVK